MPDSGDLAEHRSRAGPTRSPLGACRERQRASTASAAQTMEPVGHEAEAAKQEGNDFFRQKQYTKAVAKFSESLQH